jgi:hypothetical protein
MNDRTEHHDHHHAREALHTVKEAIFGAESPCAAVGKALRMPAEIIDPMSADVRAFVPEEPPEEVVTAAPTDEAPPPPSGEHHEMSEFSPRR